MASDEWIRQLEDGRRVKFTNETLVGSGTFLTAQIESNEVVYSVILEKGTESLSRPQVEGRFRSELSKK